MRPEWRLGALCCEFSDLPWISEPTVRTPLDEQAMAAVCAVCPVVELCRQYVAEHDVASGFWAGLPQEPELLEEVRP